MEKVGTRSYGQRRKKAQRKYKVYDLVLEVLDARLPMTSRNYRLQKLLGSKKGLLF